MFVILQEVRMLAGQKDLLKYENLGTHVRMFLQDILKKYSIQLQFPAYVHNTEPLSHLHVSSNEVVFHTQPRIPMIFQIFLEIQFMKVLQNIAVNYLLVLIINELI